MEQTLTAQISAKYWGAKILYNGAICEMTCIAYDFIGLVNPNYISDQSGDLSANEYEAKYSDCRLILKSLSDISEADAIEVAKIINDLTNASQDNFEYMLTGEVIKANFTSTTQSIFSSRSSVLWNYQVADSCRFQGYDLDNLIESGIAVDEKTLVNDKTV